jgi:hypothetical protein
MTEKKYTEREYREGQRQAAVEAFSYSYNTGSQIHGTSFAAREYLDRKYPLTTTRPRKIRLSEPGVFPVILSVKDGCLSTEFLEGAFSIASKEWTDAVRDLLANPTETVDIS